MKILFLFSGLPHYYNPVLNILNSQPGLEVNVLIPTDNKTIAIGKGVYQTSEGIKFKVFQLEEYKTFTGKAFFKGLTQLLKKERPDVIVMGWPYIFSLVFNPWVILTFKKLNIKLVCRDIPFEVPPLNEWYSFYKNHTERTENLQPRKSNKWIAIIKYWLLTKIRKYYYNLADAHVNYTEQAFDIIGSYGVEKKKIFITYNSPDTDELFATKEKIKDLPPIMNENNQRLIHVGRLVKWKRVDLLINVIAVLKNKFPRIELVVIGTGPEKTELENLAKSLKLENNIKFIGGVYKAEELGQYLSASSIYILAGMGGLSINDAMCFGKPVICSVCDGTEKKLVRNNYNGFIFKEGDLDDLASKIDYLFSNPEKITQMGLNSERIIKDEVNIHTVINGYVRAFEYIKEIHQK